MDNNEILKKLRVALQLRDDEIVEILKLVDFNISKGEIGAFCRRADHPNYRDCGDQVLRNFLNGLVLHLRGPKDSPKKKVANQPKIERKKLDPRSNPKSQGSKAGNKDKKN